MATLTYDPTPADQPEFNEAEQEALQIGEEALAEQQQLLAGKFKDTEALEQAYIELQRKLGEPKDEVQPTDQGEEEVASEEEVEEEDNAPDLTPQDVERIQALAGGPEQYNQMLLWASENLSPEDIEMFDSVISQGDKNTSFFAVSALVSKYRDEVGSEAPLLTGRGAPIVQDVFRSQAEVVSAMQDPRYDRDPAYRQDVFDKLNRSNIQY